MSNKRRFLLAIVALAGAAVLFCAFFCSRFAPRSVRYQREAVVADARTVLAAVRYLVTPELPPRHYPAIWERSLSATPQTGQPMRVVMPQTNMASLAISNPATSLFEARRTDG